MDCIIIPIGVQYIEIQQLARGCAIRKLNRVPLLCTKLGLLPVSSPCKCQLVSTSLLMSKIQLKLRTNIPVLAQSYAEVSQMPMLGVCAHESI